MNAPFTAPASGQMRRPGDERVMASAELPVERVLAACQAMFDAIHAEAQQEWDRHPQNQGIWLAEYDSKDGWLAAMSAERGPVKLQALCLAARACDTHRIRLGSEDFWKIAPFYQAG